MKDPNLLSLGGKSKILTILFTDIRNFTSIAEDTKSDKLIHELNDYLTIIFNINIERNGTIDKYLGDTIMAIMHP